MVQPLTPTDLVRSLHALTGQLLTDRTSGPAIAEALAALPLALVAHDTSTDPVFVYGNPAALSLFEATLDEFVGMPSRLSASADDRAERAAMLQGVLANGFVDDYSGPRVTLRGGRFEIVRATVWTVTSQRGETLGQAALIDEWSPA